MQRAIIISEKEFKNLKRDLIESIHEFSKRRYGFKIVSRETGEDIIDDMTVRGILSPPIERVFKAHLNEVE